MKRLPASTFRCGMRSGRRRRRLRISCQLNAAVVEALADPALRTRFADLGLEIPPREERTPEALGALQEGRD